MIPDEEIYRVAREIIIAARDAEWRSVHISDPADVQMKRFRANDRTLDEQAKSAADRIVELLSVYQKDSGRLDYIIRMSNEAKEEWLHEDVWDRLEVADSPEEAIRLTIDAAISREKAEAK